MKNNWIRGLSGGKRGAEKENKGNRVKRLNIVMAILLAVFLWAYVIEEVNPETEKTIPGIPLNVVGENALAAQGLVVITEFDDTITAVLTGRRSEIYNMTASRLSAKIDVSDCKEGENHLVVKVSAPSNVDEAVARDGDLKVLVDRVIEAEKPVEVVVSGELNNGNDVEVSEPERKTVTVSGPTTYVERVDSVIGVLKVKNDQNEYQQTVHLVPVDAGGKIVKGVELAVEEIAVKAVKVLTKSVAVDVDFVGTPPEGVELVFPEAISVNVRGKYNFLRDMDSVKAEAVDVSEIREDTEIGLIVRLPAGVEALDASGKPLAGQQEGVVTVKIKIKVKNSEPDQGEE